MKDPPPLPTTTGKKISPNIKSSQQLLVCVIFENNEDWFFKLEIYFCDYIFSKFIHTFIIYPVRVISVAVV